MRDQKRPSFRTNKKIKPFNQSINRRRVDFLNEIVYRVCIARICNYTVHCTMSTNGNSFASQFSSSRPCCSSISKTVFFGLKMKHAIGLVIGVLLSVLRGGVTAESQIAADSSSEELFISPLKTGHVYLHFKFVSSTPLQSHCKGRFDAFFSVRRISIYLEVRIETSP